MSLAMCGDPEAFEQVLLECQRVLLAIACEEFPPDLRAKAGASDLVQDTLSAALKDQSQFRGKTLPEARAWLSAILRHQLAAFARRYKGTASRSIHREVILEGTATGVSVPECSAPDAEALKQETRDRLTAALSNLSDDARLVVILRVEHGCTFPEIAQRLGRTPEAVRKMFDRSLNRLRDFIPLGLQPATTHG